MNDRKNIFFTSDWHLLHANVIVFDERPFKDVNHMNEELITRYNATVPVDGICYFLGDMGLSKQDKLLPIIKRLNGTKVLVLGNHDKNTYSMYNAGFDVVLNAAVIYIGKYRVSMSHCPLPGIFREQATGQKPGENWHGEFKQQRFTSQDLTVDFHLHGHIHSDGKVKPKFTARQYDVGVRANGYKPVSISTIESWMANCLYGPKEDI